MILGDKHGACRLCRSSAAPLRKSHIVPEFCYDYEYRSSGRRALAVYLPVNGVHQERNLRKGHREYLFCTKCEQILGKHENAFAAFWKKNPQLEGPFSLSHEQLVVLKGLDYHHTKLFLLSVLWRASLSEKLGQGMDLGPYSEKLRSIVLKDEKVRQDAYPIFGRVILDDEGYPFKGFVTDALCIRHGQARRYSMCFAGCEWNIFMSDHGVPKPFEALQHTLSEDGKLHLMATHHSKIPSVRQIAQRMRRGKG